MQTRLTLILLALLLAACTPVVAPAAPPSNTPALVLTPRPPTLTPTPFYVEATASPLPPSPTLPPMITPDAAQVEHWQEYQAGLAKAILPMLAVETVLCEWNVLARVGQEVYVWAVCATIHGDDTRPAVIHLGADGSVQGVEIPKRGSLSDFNRLFPEAARVKMNWYVDDMDNSGEGMIRELRSHIEYRKTHLAEPPLIVLSAAPVSTPTLLPTQPPISILTPDAIQVDRWREYQKELAKRVLADGGGIFPAYETAVCEWDILGSSNQDVYVWAQCFAPGSGGSGPAVIHLNTDDSVIDVTYAFPGSDRDSRITELFPLDVQEKIDLYFSYWSSDSGIVHELRLHIQYRQTHPDVPPLVILSAMQDATPTP